MTRAKQTPASAQRIGNSKPGSREARAAAKAAERYASGGGQASGGHTNNSNNNNNNTHSHHGEAYDCPNRNRYGAYCTVWQPCDVHAGTRSGGT
ncbi:hypothetical protein L207DRAFT_581239 [Hyaloscypha variabilis F]|uniref:Uncharacterized protein n=1 Tax=Hyaloscypha variabilis (strain UAMH 11265 / GT02V1 / F) TaxID=1149755 RepID=A0A2J6RVM5_HYAVF|nr:hypothetical protein L207DRAFT_581239 [Hyaloscypha variabilis F]